MRCCNSKHLYGYAKSLNGRFRLWGVCKLVELSSYIHILNYLEYKYRENFHFSTAWQFIICHGKWCVVQDIIQMLLDRHVASATSLASLFQCLTTTVKKYFLISSLNHLWYSLVHFPSYGWYPKIPLVIRDETGVSLYISPFQEP